MDELIIPYTWTYCTDHVCTAAWMGPFCWFIYLLVCISISMNCYHIILVFTQIHQYYGQTTFYATFLGMLNLNMAFTLGRPSLGTLLRRVL